MKYASSLKCLYYIGKCSKYLYYLKKILCFLALIITGIASVNLISKACCSCKTFREMV